MTDKDFYKSYQKYIVDQSKVREAGTQPTLFDVKCTCDTKMTDAIPGFHYWDCPVREAVREAYTRKLIDESKDLSKGTI